MLVAQRDGDGPATLQNYRAVPNLSSTLGQLGYGGLHDTTYRAVLLVEGPTEVKVFQELLSKFGVRNELAILSLGGDGMASGGRSAELAELRRLSEAVFAIVDGERPSVEDEPAARRRAFASDCEDLGITCHILERRAIENYLDLEVARRVMSKQQSAVDFGPFDRPAREWGWSKERNWRVAALMQKEVLDGTDLGIFLERLCSQVLS